jgi:uncharacterized membrane protein YheB (UPF0754 family)
VGASFFKAFAAGMKAGAADAPLGAIVDIDDRTLEGLALSASDGLTEMAAAESSGMLRSLDVRSLVVDKINTLDMIEVERMILKVVDKELGAITMFGGVLGAAIGIFQSLFMLLG